MKKLILSLAAVALTASVSAQTVVESKTFDNFYVGINGGFNVKTTGSHGWLKRQSWNPNLGVRVGRYFTPVVGLAVESNLYLSNKYGTDRGSFGTFIRTMNTSVLGTINFSNWFGGYQGEPRFFEVYGLYGLGWGHVFGSKKNANFQRVYGGVHDNFLTSKAAIDFAFNFGKDKQWQAYVEPALVWAIGGNDRAPEYGNAVRYDIRHSFTQLNLGIIYKFKNSNGTHNFKIAELRDQSEIDALNSKINDLRNDVNGKDSQLAAKDRQISDLQKALDDCNSKKAESVNNDGSLKPTVLFRKSKSVVDKSQYTAIKMIARYMKQNPDAKFEIKGYASPEGTAEYNQKLSERRAEAVKKILVRNYGIKANRLETKGYGPTDKLYEQVEFNRVAVFDGK